MLKIYYENTRLDTAPAIALYVLLFAIVALIALPAVFLGRNKKPDRTKAVVYAAISIALAFGLSYVKLYSLPLGGSVTLASLLPLMLYSYMFGIRRGVLAGLLYGFLQFVQEPYFLHPAQFLLDYPVAFAAVGLAGLFHDLKLFEKIKVIQFVAGAILAVTIRYASHVVSGIFVFGSDDPENYNAVAWSFLYNSFTLADLVIDLVAGAAMFSSRALVRLFDAAPGAVKQARSNNKND